MNRTRIEQELSLHLDGRLPSGRREKLLAHLAESEDTERLWEEMQSAQELALQLPGHEIGREFHDTLWKRIRSGEGTPEAVFREPVPLTTRLRYVATGAAAAAAAIACLQLLRGDGTPSSPKADVAVTQGGDDPVRPDTQASYATFAPMAPLNPLTLARASREGTIEGVQRLRSRIPEIERQIEVVEPRKLVVQLDPELERVRGFADLMHWMHDERIIELPGQLQAALEQAMRSIDRIEQANTRNDPHLLRFAVQDLKDLDPDRLRVDFGVVCCTDPQEFMQRLRELAYHNLDVGRALRIEVVEETPGTPFVPRMPFDWSGFGNGPSDNAPVLRLWIRQPGALPQRPSVHVEVETSRRGGSNR